MRIINKNILFAVSSMGLGHAQRSLPIIKSLLQHYNTITIVSFGNALTLLKKELEGMNGLSFLEYPDYPPLQRKEGMSHYFYLIKDFLEMRALIKKEHRYASDLIKSKNIDVVFSDAKFGFYNEKVLSFLICHQIRILVPRLIFFYQILFDVFQYFLLKKFNRIIVPDFHSNTENLSGKLSHNWIAKKLKPLYIGFLSSVEYKETAPSTDVLFIIGGFLEEKREKLINFVTEQLRNSELKKVFVLGSFKDGYVHSAGENFELYSFVYGELRSKLMNEARVIIGRTGYTTIMDICEIKKAAVLIPTKNMTEQEYLAKLIKKNKYFSIFNRSTALSLKELESARFDIPYSIASWNTKKSLEIFAKEICELI